MVLKLDLSFDVNGKSVLDLSVFGAFRLTVVALSDMITRKFENC